MRLVFAGTPQVALPVAGGAAGLPARGGRRHHPPRRPVRPRPAGHAQPGPGPGRGARHRGADALAAARARVPGAAAPLAPDCCPVVAYGALVPLAALTSRATAGSTCTSRCCPPGAGAAPVQRALIAGDEVMGASTFLLEEGLDTGPVYGVMTELVRPDDTAGDLLERVAEGGRRAARADPGRHRGRHPAAGAPAGRRGVRRPQAHGRGRPGRLGGTRRSRSTGWSAAARRRPVPGRPSAASGSSSARCGSRPASRAGRRARAAGPGRRRGQPALRAGRHRRRRRCCSARCSRTAGARCRPVTGPAAPGSTPASGSTGDSLPSDHDPVTSAAGLAGVATAARTASAVRPVAGAAGPQHRPGPARGVRRAASGARTGRLREPGAARRCCGPGGSSGGTRRSRPSWPTARCAGRARTTPCWTPAWTSRCRATPGCATRCAWGRTSCSACGCRPTPRSARRSGWSARPSAPVRAVWPTPCCGGWAERDLAGLGRRARAAGRPDLVGHLTSPRATRPGWSAHSATPSPRTTVSCAATPPGWTAS